MSNLDATQLATVIDSAYRFISNADYDAAYQLLVPVAESGAATGTDLGRVNMYLGDTCMGLGSLDAAMQYYQAALTDAGADDADYIRRRMTDIGEHDAAAEAAQDGVAGEDEASRVLQSAADALDRGDYSDARQWYQHAWEGIQMTDSQVAGAALGLYKCALNDGQLDEAEGYLQIAEARSPEHAETVAAYREQIAERRAGSSIGADGVALTELDEINNAAIAATWDSDYGTARRLFEQMLESNMLPATDRGRVLRNLAVTLVYLHDYDAARTAAEEAARVGTAETQQLATVMLQQLAANAEAAEIVAGIDLAAP